MRPVFLQVGAFYDFSSDALAVLTCEVFLWRMYLVGTRWFPAEVSFQGAGGEIVEAGLVMKVAYDENLIITEEQLRIDLDEIRRSIENAHADAFCLSLSVAYPTMENMEVLVQVAHREAYVLAINAAISTKETMKDLIRRAQAEMLSLR